VAAVQAVDGPSQPLSPPSQRLAAEFEAGNRNTSQSTVVVLG
jgi:hypothetical protein